MLRGGANIVRLSPDLCGSFAIWPKNGEKGDNLLEVCKTDTLRPQFVFLALNWSNKIQKAGKQSVLSSPAEYFKGMPRWNNFHNISKETPKRSQSRLEEFFESKDAPNLFRGAYITDFVKGYIAQNSPDVYKFLKGGKIEGTDDKPFVVFADILRQELDALDWALGNQTVTKYLIVFGPTIYKELQRLAHNICGKTLDELFPGRKIVYTGAFYSNVRGLTRNENVERMREIHHLLLGKPIYLENIKVTRS